MDAIASIGSERLRIRLLPDPPKPLIPSSDAEIRRLVLFHPRGRLQGRTWTLVLLLLDTGLRLDEALTLMRERWTCTTPCSEFTARAIGNALCQSRWSEGNGYICC